jgi:LuxR family maltose regulon positive regulatory protein
VQHLLNAFPAAFREESPQLLLVRGLVGWVGWDFVAMLDLFERARRTFEAAGDTAGASIAGAYSAHGLIMAGHLAEAASLLGQLESRPLPLETRALVLNGLYWLAIDQGRMFDVAAIHAEQLELLQRSRSVALAYQSSPPLRLPGLRGVTRNLARHGDWLLEVGGEEPTPLRPLGILSHAWVAAWQGRLREAHALREQARAEAAWSGGSGAVMAHLLTHAAFSFTMSGQKAEAIAAARERAARQRHTGTWSGYILATLSARITAACGEAAELRQSLTEARTLVARLHAAGIPASEILLEPATAQLAWLEGRAEDAIRQWRHALRDEAAMDVYGQAAETRVRLAFALLRKGEFAEASRILQSALDNALAEDAPGGMLLAGTALRELAGAGWRGHLPGSHQQQLRDWAQMLEAVDEAPAGAEAGLSPRELEVLAHIAAGDSNKHIARALDLSPHTVKRHVANILGKLGVETRGQAAASYQALLR